MQSPIVPVGAQTTFVDVWKWGQELERLLNCFLSSKLRLFPDIPALLHVATARRGRFSERNS